MSLISHSGRFSEWTATRSPGSIPSARKAWPASWMCSQYDAQVHSRQMPMSLSRMRDGLRHRGRVVADPGDRARLMGGRHLLAEVGATTSGWRCTSSGVPVVIAVPKSSTITRSARSITRPMSCSTMMIGIPSSSRMSRM